MKQLQPFPMIFMNLQVKFQVKAIAEPLYGKYEKGLIVLQSELQTFRVKSQTATVEADGFTMDDADDQKLALHTKNMEMLTTLAEHHLGGAKASLRKTCTSNISCYFNVNLCFLFYMALFDELMLCFNIVVWSLLSFVDLSFIRVGTFPLYIIIYLCIYLF